MLVVFQNAYWRKALQVQVLFLLCFTKSYFGKTSEDTFQGISFMIFFQIILVFNGWHYYLLPMNSKSSLHLYGLCIILPGSFEVIGILVLLVYVQCLDLTIFIQLCNKRSISILHLHLPGVSIIYSWRRQHIATYWLFTRKPESPRNHPITHLRERCSVQQLNVFLAHKQSNTFSFVNIKLSE